jgi:2-polyprenyl-3-methyl-5-hydroxy-6-metoxy-1,4-benzoquinol methylase
MIKRIYRKLRSILDGGNQTTPFVSPHQAEIERIRSIYSEAVADYKGSYEGNFWLTPETLLRYLGNHRVHFYIEVFHAASTKVNWNQAGSIADFACGPGVVPFLAHQHTRELGLSPRICALDLNPGALELIKRVIPDVYTEPLDVLKGTSSTFNVVFMMDVIEHLADPTSAVKRTLESVEGGGILVIAVPDGRQDTYAADPNPDFPDGRIYNGHINFWSPESWQFYFRHQFPDLNVEFGYVPNRYGGVSENLAFIFK